MLRICSNNFCFVFFFFGNKLTIHAQLTFRLQQFLAYFAVAIPSARPTVNEAKKKWNSLGLKDESPVIV